MPCFLLFLLLLSLVLNIFVSLHFPHGSRLGLPITFCFFYSSLHVFFFFFVGVEFSVESFCLPSLRSRVQIAPLICFMFALLISSWLSLLGLSIYKANTEGWRHSGKSPRTFSITTSTTITAMDLTYKEREKRSSHGKSVRKDTPPLRTGWRPQLQARFLCPTPSDRGGCLTKFPLRANVASMDSGTVEANAKVLQQHDSPRHTLPRVGLAKHLLILSILNILPMCCLHSLYIHYKNKGMQELGHGWHAQNQRAQFSHPQ